MTPSQVSLLLQGASVIATLWGLLVIAKAVWIRFFSHWTTAKTSGGTIKFSQEVFIGIALLIAAAFLYAASLN